MKEKNHSKYILIILILSLNFFYSYLFYKIPGTIIISFIILVPLAFYQLKYGIDGILNFSIIVLTICIYTIYGAITGISYTLLVIVPSIILGVLLKQKLEFSKKISILSMVYFICFFSVIVIMNNLYNIDIVAIYFEGIDIVNNQFIEVYRNYIFEKTNSKESFLVIQGFKDFFYSMKYYYPASLYISCAIISAIYVIIAEMIISRFKLVEFNTKSIMKFKVSRKMILFLIFIFIFRAISYNDSYIIIAIDNLLIILMCVLFFVGLLFEIFMIKLAKNNGQKVLRIIVSIFCLIFFQSYFVFVGFIDGIFQIKNKLLKV
jgi:hypothetical protein